MLFISVLWLFTVGLLIYTNDLKDAYLQDTILLNERIAELEHEKEILIDELDNKNRIIEREEF